MAEDINKYNIPTDIESPSTSRIKLGAMSFPSLKIQSGEIYEEAERELRFPFCIPIYQQMALEPTIASALSLLEMLISRSEWKATVAKTAPQEEKDRAEFINWNMQNMYRSWGDYIVEWVNYLIYGFQPVEKIYTRVKEGEHKGKYAVKDFRSISPTTVSKWIYNMETKELAGLRQDLSRISTDFSRGAILRGSGVWNDIPRKKFMLFRYSAKMDNPQGQSPLRSCYISWKQKAAVEDYELIGISRDLG